ncbi:MAG: hypothetical protein ACE5WD_10135 [Candidatus Aminicenantia bacterium]
MKRKIRTCILVIILIGGYLIQKENLKSEVLSDSFNLQHIRTIKLTDKAEGGGARPEIVFANGRFYIIFLGGIIHGFERSFKVKICDLYFNELATKILVTSSPIYGGPTDIRISKDEDNLYVFYEMASKEKGAHLFGAKYKLDREFTKLAAAEYPIAEGPYWFDTKIGDETLDDPTSIVIDGQVYVMTKLRTGIIPQSDTYYRLREISPDLSQVLSTRDLDLSNAINGGASVNSLFYDQNFIYSVLPTVIRPFCGPGGGPEVADLNLALIRFDKNWNFNAYYDVLTLTSNSEVEHMPTGVRLVNDYLYVVHHETPREWDCTGLEEGPGKGNIIKLKVYDNNYNLVEDIQVTDEGYRGKHPTIEIIGHRVYVAYGSNELGGDRGNVVVKVYERIKKTRRKR